MFDKHDKKVLVVDDQYGIRILLYEVLGKEGYKTFQAANGKMALEIVEKSRQIWSFST